MLDCRRVESLRLRFPDGVRDDLVLGRGVHAFGRGRDGEPVPVVKADQARLQVSIDRRGAWLQVRQGIGGLHVNGRPIQRMAMLRAGDHVHVDGVELVLIGQAPRPAPARVRPPASAQHLVLRGIGGIHHGRAFPLDGPTVLGRSPEADIRVDAPGVAPLHARLEPHEDSVVLRDAGGGGVWVDGHQVRDALLRPGTQLLAGSGQRFVLEAPLVPVRADSPGAGTAPSQAAEPVAPVAIPRGPVARSMRRMPWLLLAALALAGLLTLLLLYGAR